MPASMAALIRSTWVGVGEAMMMASTSPESSTSAGSVATRAAPYFSAVAFAPSTKGSHTQ